MQIMVQGHFMVSSYMFLDVKDLTIKDLVKGTGWESSEEVLKGGSPTECRDLFQTQLGADLSQRQEGPETYFYAKAKASTQQIVIP